MIHGRHKMLLSVTIVYIYQKNTFLFKQKSFDDNTYFRITVKSPNTNYYLYFFYIFTVYTATILQTNRFYPLVRK